MNAARREAVARTLYRFVEGTMADNRMPWPILCDRYPGTAEHYRAMADETLATIEATPGPADDPTCPECGGAMQTCPFCHGVGTWPRTTPGPAAVSEAEVVCKICGGIRRNEV